MLLNIQQIDEVFTDFTELNSFSSTMQYVNLSVLGTDFSQTKLSEALKQH